VWDLCYSHHSLTCIIIHCLLLTNVLGPTEEPFVLLPLDCLRLLVESLTISPVFKYKLSSLCKNMCLWLLYKVRNKWHKWHFFDWLIDCLLAWLIDWLTDWLWLIDCDWLIDWLIDWFNHIMEQLPTVFSPLMWDK